MGTCGEGSDSSCKRKRRNQVGGEEGTCVGLARLRGFVFYPEGSAVWPQYWLCAVCAVGRVGCCVWGVPCGGKHIIIICGEGSDSFCKSIQEDAGGGERMIPVGRVPDSSCKQRRADTGWGGWRGPIINVCIHIYICILLQT